MLRCSHFILLKVGNSLPYRGYLLTKAKAWTRIVFAEGPRQVLNALTLYSVLQADLIPKKGKHAATSGQSPAVQFFNNIEILASGNREQAVVLIGMLWTLVIWIISALSLVASLVLYLLFLFHHIPSEDGTLTNYCRRKINRRMERIIKTKVDKALKKEEQLRARQDAKDGRDVKRQPTFPILDDAREPAIPVLSRQLTQTTLPEYTSREGSFRNSAETLDQRPTLPDVGLATGRPPPPSRTATQTSFTSWTSHASNAPLMGDAAGMGYSPSIPTPGPATSAGWPARPPPGRSITGMSQSTQRSYTPGFGARSSSAQGDRTTPGTYPLEPLSRPGAGMGSGPGSAARHGPGPSPTDSQGRLTPATQYSPYVPPVLETSRQLSGPPPSNRSQTPSGTMPTPRSFTPGGSRSMTPDSQSIGGGPPYPLRSQTAQSSNNRGYMAYSPNNYSGMPNSTAPSGPYRSFTQPNISSGMPMYSSRQAPQSSQSSYPPQRSGTAPLPQRYNSVDVMDDIVNGYR